jgi:hypothetical protein
MAFLDTNKTPGSSSNIFCAPVHALDFSHLRYVNRVVNPESKQQDFRLSDLQQYLYNDIKQSYREYHNSLISSKNGKQKQQNKPHQKSLSRNNSSKSMCNGSSTRWRDLGNGLYLHQYPELRYLISAQQQIDVAALYAIFTENNIPHTMQKRILLHIKGTKFHPQCKSVRECEAKLEGDMRVLVAIFECAGGEVPDGLLEGIVAYDGRIDESVGMETVRRTGLVRVARKVRNAVNVLKKCCSNDEKDDGRL